MNDITVPFLSLFIQDYIQTLTYNPYFEPDHTDSQIELTHEKVEADTYFCFSKILDGIMDNYTTNTPGINKSISIIKDVVKKVDKGLFRHLKESGRESGTDLIHFACFKWVTCLLIREFPLNLSMRLFDTYISDD